MRDVNVKVPRHELLLDTSNRGIKVMLRNLLFQQADIVQETPAHSVKVRSVTGIPRFAQSRVHLVPVSAHALNQKHDLAKTTVGFARSACGSCQLTPKANKNNNKLISF